jgi:filamentous hemagglutinin
MEGLLKEHHPDATIHSTTLPGLSQPNVKLAGQGKILSDGTEVPFCVRGMPILDKHVVYEMKLPMESLKNDSSAHMREATRSLRNEIEKGNVSSDLFAREQMIAIQGGKERIPGFTWHHHQDHGKMKLVDREIHSKISHVGGMELWGVKP